MMLTYPLSVVVAVVAVVGSDLTIAFNNQGIKKINKEYTTLDVL